MLPQQYCLRWKHHHSNVQNMFAQLLEKERFCDVTLYCSPSFATQVPDKDTVDPNHIRGVSLRAHRVVLAACSELLGALLGAHEAQGEPVLVIDGAEPKHLRALLDYMYTGEMNVHHSQLASLLKTAEELRIKGLTDIRWNNKDEPPDCDSGVVTAVPTHDKKAEAKQPERAAEPKQAEPKQAEQKHASPKLASPKLTSPKASPRSDGEPRPRSDDQSDVKEKFNVNGGPPPLIKLPTKEKSSPIKRENSDSDTPSPKRQRLISGADNTDEESVSQSITDKDTEWQHGNLNITAERVVGWGQGPGSAEGEWSREPSDDEWENDPADIGSFLHTRLKVAGDNSADEESMDSTGCATSVASAASTAATSSTAAIDLPQGHKMCSKSSGPVDPRFPDVVKLSDYLQHGRRPQFWEENYVKRVMEAVRMKELEMKQAAEILGVSYGTLYGRYRDVYGCINRPYRTARDFWQAKGPSEVIERLQRGEISVEAASLALGVGVNNLAAYMTSDFTADKDFEPIPIEVDPSLKVRRPFNTTSAGAAPAKSPAPAVLTMVRKTVPTDKPAPKKILVGTVLEDESTTAGNDKSATAISSAASGKWPTIRVASLDSLRGNESTPASPSALMRTRPDLTIVAAKKDPPKASDDT